MFRIFDILGSIDDKIENNKKIVRKLESLYLFYYNKLNNSSSNIVPLSDIATISTGKRPELRDERQSSNAQYPIIGASGIIGYTADYSYNSQIIITGRVGTLGVVQMINSKCWPSDNSLIIETKYPSFCYHVLKSINYDALNRGSSQPLITQSDLKSIKVILPNIEELQVYEKNFDWKSIFHLQQINNKLLALKQLYLKKFFD